MPTITEQLELTEFSPAENEAVECSPEELEGLSEFQEQESLEDVKFEAVSENMEANFYDDAQTPTSVPTGDVNRQMLKSLTIITKHIVTKITYNPKARVKLQAACSQGPGAVVQLLLPSIKKVFPSFLQWLPDMYLPAVIRTLFKPICKKCGTSKRNGGNGGVIRRQIEFTDF